MFDVTDKNSPGIFAVSAHLMKYNNPRESCVRLFLVRARNIYEAMGLLHGEAGRYNFRIDAWDAALVTTNDIREGEALHSPFDGPSIYDGRFEDKKGE